MPARRVSVTVHYGKDYDNAFWDGSQLVFGDGDGTVFERFTKSADVLAHEFGHAVTEHTTGLVYRDQSGALNESVSDVFAACFKQHLAGEDAAGGDWLIGEGIFVAGINARALRDMAAPGTAYDDPTLGADPQVGHMDDFIVTVRGQRRRPPQLRHPQPRLPARGHRDRWHEPRGRRSDLVRRTDGRQPQADRRLRGLRGGHRRRGRRPRCRRHERVAAGGRDGRRDHGSRPRIPRRARKGAVRVRRIGGFAGRTEEGVLVARRRR